MSVEPIESIPVVLDRSNIESVIRDYKKLIGEFPLKIEEKSIIAFLNKIKRDKVGVGPYPGVTLFEAANRIMTDLTILYGVRDLFKGRIPEINFEAFEVEYGNQDKFPHDIIASNSIHELAGEAFNVAPSFFQGKKTAALKKLRSKSKKKDFLLLVYNADAPPKNYNPKGEDKVIHLPVDLSIFNA